MAFVCLPKNSASPRFAAFPLLAWILFHATICAAHNQQVPPEDVSIGVLSYRGTEAVFRRWSPTTDYLNKHIPGYRFQLIPLDLHEMSSAVAENQVQFILTNPGHYVELEAQLGISRIATMQTIHAGKISTRFSAVIFTSAENRGIRTLKDLRGKSFMSVSPEAFGGFQMAWRELAEQHIDPYEDFSRLEFVGFPQDQVVTAVYERRVDAASVRAETLQHMIDDGVYDASDFRIINLQPAGDSVIPRSTRLYPEWPFAKTKNTSRELATKVTVALLAMPINHNAASKSHGAGWTVPLDYSSVHELLKSLQIGPYLVLRESNLSATVEEYAAWLVSALLFIIFLIVLVVYISRTNRRLIDSDYMLRKEIAERRQSQIKLAQYKDTLEQRVIARTREIELANKSSQKSQIVLHRLVDVTSSPRLSHEEKLSKLLETGREYYQTAVASLSRLDGYELGSCIVADNSGLLRNHSGPLNNIGMQQVLVQFDAPLDIPDLNSGNFKFPGCGCEAVNSYLAVAVMVKGKPHSVLEFADIHIRKSTYTRWDRNLLLVMARWIGSEIEKQDAIEEKQRNQAELARVGRMSAMGEMAAGLAHELNQPLTGAINYSSGCLRRLKQNNYDREKLIQGLERTIEGATMAADIIRQLREFMQKGDAGKKLVELNDVVLKIVDLVSSEIKLHYTTVSLQLAEALPPIIANEIQLEQVILNFIRNSLDAMEGTEIGKREIILRTELNIDKVKLSVVDFGNGIQPNSETELFDAFYTTKTDGMGMGLSISRSIIEEHDGTISASSPNGTGACFSFEIPVSSGVM